MAQLCTKTLQSVDDFAKRLVFERGSGDLGYMEMNDSEYWISEGPAAPEWEKENGP